MTWDEIYRRQWEPLVAYTRRRSLPGTDAEDVAATAMLRVWRQNHPPDSSHEVIRYCLQQTVRWLLKVPPGVSKRTGKPGWRTNWGNRVQFPEWYDIPTPGPSGKLTDWFPDDLPDDCRRVLTMVFVNRMTLREVGIEHGKDEECAERWAMAIYQRGVYQIACSFGVGGRRKNRDGAAHRWA